MDSEIRRTVAEKVREILEAADMDTATEMTVRELAAASLGVDLSDLDSKKLVRDVIETFLLSTCDVDGGGGGGARVCVGKENTITNANAGLVGGGEEKGKLNLVEEGKESGKEGFRFLCKLSNKRSVAIKDSAEEKVVLIGEFLWKDGKRVPGSKGISLTGEQWLTFRKSFPAIEEAIKKVKTNIRSDSSELERKQIESNGKCDPHPTNGDIHHGPEFKKRKLDIFPAAEAAQKQTEKKPVAASTPKQKLDIFPIQIVRFDGKNYHDWARRMELFLKQLNLAYVLADPCPTAVGVNTREIPQILATVQKWMDDDYICRTNILNSLSDHLFDAFTKKGGSAKELWDELKVLYLAEEHGSKVSLVKKYMEFQMSEGKSVVAQAQELNDLADSLVPHGMHVEESFHLNAIISKLPASWKGVGVKLMRETNLPVWMLMNCLRQEEELRKRGKRGASPTITADGGEPPRGRRGLQPAYDNRPGKFAPERERKAALFCTICKRKGHPEEKCWFKNNKYDNGKSSTVAVSDSEEKVPK